MKRETKLGLLIGVAMILLISVVVTDYLSTPSNQEPADMTTFAPAAERSVIGRTTDSVRDWISEQTGSASSQNTDARQSYIPLPDDGQRQAPRQQSDHDVRHTAPRETQPGHRMQQEQNFGSVAERSDYQPYENPEAISEREIPESTIVRTEPVTHIVAPGENLYKIAKRYYGDGEYWNTIAKANRAIDDDSGMIIPGQKILIPNLAGRVVTPDPQPRITAVSNDQRQGQVSQPATLMRVTRTRQIVTVQSGDNLSRIAKRELGDEKHWKLILEANKNLISDPDEIRAGMELTMPTIERIEPVQRTTAPPPSSTVVRRSSSSSTRPTLSATTQLPTPSVSRITRPSPFDAQTTYTVKPGDSLASLARRYYGDPEKWRVLYDANRELLNNPDDLHVGDVLTIPQR